MAANIGRHLGDKIKPVDLAPEYLATECIQTETLLVDK